jgi:hypothetical protein
VVLGWGLLAFRWIIGMNGMAFWLLKCLGHSGYPFLGFLLSAPLPALDQLPPGPRAKQTIPLLLAVPVLPRSLFPPSTTNPLSQPASTRER